ncbi:MAG: DASS family sodium-coupled anion symporter, partial [Myxococcales bacterium]|nr:DASS family sodium-coupled anion symporter [Myxococcales bacterium]
RIDSLVLHQRRRPDGDARAINRRNDALAGDAFELGGVEPLVGALLEPDAGARAPGDLDPAGRATAAVALWMAIWWLGESIPIHATALLPLALFPLLGVATPVEAAAPYAHPLIFLFMGGFMLALAMQRSGLHRRFALATLAAVGDRPANMVAGFMAAAAALSMWVSNTATAVMLLPVGTSVIALAESRAPAAWNDAGRRGFATALLLGIAYGASIGGVATPIGTPPNLFLLSYLSSELGLEISFGRWMAVGVPLVLVMGPASWWLLVHRLFSVPEAPLEGGREVIARDRRALGPMSPAERRVLGVFVVVCGLWIGEPWLAGVALGAWHPLAGLGDAGIAIGGALALFCLPDGRGGRVLDWETASTLPFGVLILFGGGLSLAAAIGRHGVDDWIGAQGAGLAGWPLVVIVGVVVTGMVFLTELTSNTASTAALVPVLASLATGIGLPPIALAVPAAIAASFAFMLPVATPPNAVVFGSGRVALTDMIRAGLWLNALGIVVITFFVFALVLPVLGG